MGKAISFQDIFKNNFLKSQEFEGVTLSQVLIALLFAFAAGMFIYLIYRSASNSAMFINSFAISLVALTMITTVIIITITSNVLLSLGMVGALSIVRFRTAVKEAIDIVYMFWAIAIGIAVGAGFFFIATISSVCIGLFLFVMSKFTSNENSFVLVVTTHSQSSQAEIEAVLKKQVKRYCFKAKTSNSASSELTYEVRLGKKTDFTHEITEIKGVDSVSLVGFKTQNYM